MQIFKLKRNRRNIYLLKEMPFTIKIQQGESGVAYFKSGKKSPINCLGCLNPKCMFFSEKEITCDKVKSFPYDKTLSTCPVGAISWDEHSECPAIDAKKCISCGICVSRCPVGALYFSNKGEPIVNSEMSPLVERRITEIEAETSHNQQINQLSNIHHIGTSLNANDDLFDMIYDKLTHLNSSYHNTVGRNLLISLGCQSAMRRIGDVYTRMDAIYSSSAGSFGAVEIEFGKDTLDASRGILDDIAVLNTRYGVNKNDNNALVICLQLPNARQGYWQVVRDVKEVEGIKIQTITVGALMFLLWNGYILKPENSRYYIDYDNMNLRKILCAQVNRNNISISDKKLGILEPMK